MADERIEAYQPGQARVVIEGVTPEIDCGEFPIKRVVGESVSVEADIFVDGHDSLSAVVKHRYANSRWVEVPMTPLGNDRWRARFRVDRLGDYFYTLAGWVDHFRSWRRDLEKKVAAGQNVAVDLLIGAQLVRDAGEQTSSTADAERLRDSAVRLTDAVPIDQRIELALSDELDGLMRRNAVRRHITEYGKELRVMVEPVLARFGAWYELFPRSTSREPGRHGTFQDCETQLPRVARMGFDILYLPPIHPIGRQFRKGRNNNPTCEPGEPGSPWAIGAEEGGHKSVHPELGTLEDFRRLIKAAKAYNIEIALDIAFQCSPDHPYVKEHPEWFKKRPDGTIQYAENPPKKYQDIYPFDFETDDWPALWNELKSVFEFWIEQGVWIFRVDNPHTKSLRFWEWAVTELKHAHPEILLLSEAFTRPRVLYRLAKLGFSQSYNYFPWRNEKAELTEYLTELTQTEVKEYMRPNLWPNTPDILTQYLQYGGKSAFIVRLVLAATLGASYGIYGPAYELCENRAKAHGSEEYFNSEKYEVKHWNSDAPGNLQDLIANLNQIRRDNSALHWNDTLYFHEISNDQLIAYSKSNEDRSNVILVVANLDPHHAQRGWTNLDLEQLGIAADITFQAHDLLTGARYLWRGPRNYVEIDPQFLPVHIFRLRHRIRTEHDFDYFM